MMKKIFFLPFVATLLLSACNDNKKVPDINTEFEKQLQEKFANAQDGDIIELPEGIFTLNNTIVLDKAKNITVRGKGQNKTILSFKTQKGTAEGFSITAGGVTLEDFSVMDTKGDAIKIKDAENITLRGIKAGWSSQHNAANGGYGLNPVNCTGVLIEDCEVSGASVAAIDISQCKNVIARKNHVHDNVAGIEIDNSTDADVYENLSENNAVGILLSAIPGLPKKVCSRCRVFNDRILNNNSADFGMKGSIVSEIPAGTGIALVAADGAEVFNNEIDGQNTEAIAIFSYRSFQKPFDDAAYYPYCSAIHIHDNKISHGNGGADENTTLGKELSKTFKDKLPDIIYDGAIGPNAKNTDGSLKETEKICIRNNGNATFSDLDLTGQGKNRSGDLSRFNCNLAPLIEIKLN